MNHRLQLTPPTEREKQCLANALMHGRKEAATRLGIANSTLRNHLNILNHKLAAENMREAAMCLGWLIIPTEYVVQFGPAPKLPEQHHELAAQLLRYADGILQDLEERRPNAPLSDEGAR